MRGTTKDALERFEVLWGLLDRSLLASLGTHFTLLALVKPFLAICALRLGPQDLPTSSVLLGVTLAAHTVTGILLSTVSLPAGTAVLAGCTDTILLCALTASVLYLQRKGTRLYQTLSALAGAGALIGIIALPATSWLHDARETGDDTAMPALMLLVLIGWSLVVTGHILRNALSTLFILGLLLAMFFYWLSINILHTLFPITT